LANKRGILSLLSVPEDNAPGSIFSRLPTLQTPRLLLRSLTMRDAADIYHYSKDPLVAEHVLWDAHESIHQTRAYLRYILRQYKSGEPSSFGIVEKASGKVIGTIGYMWISQDNASGEVGYSLSRAHWNQGYMTEALNAVIDFGFEELHLNRIEAQHETTNPASGRVMAKVGMRPEGVLRARVFNKGKFMDVALYAILRSDWKQRAGIQS